VNVKPALVAGAGAGAVAGAGTETGAGGGVCAAWLADAAHSTADNIIDGWRYFTWFPQSLLGVQRNAIGNFSLCGIVLMVAQR
jgi:hypothetical protein